ncbi:MAG: CpsD/CapB family tyrosine-protein kinase [Candidatus Omnitrophota bacterium]
MGRITDALKKVADERVQRIQKKPETQYVIKKVENTSIDDHIVSFHDPSSPVGEQYKIIRTNLQSIKAARDSRIFLITSSINGEGKTITSINLTMSMAHDLNNKSILLIDADLRKGRVAKYLGINQSPGLSDLLQDKGNMESVLISPGVDNLSIMPAGKVPRNPAELLSSKKMTSILASLKAKFDYVFIDSPPVIPVTDPCILGSMVDGVILVIQAGRTQRSIVKHTEQRLAQAHAKTIGCIMTNIEYHLPQYLYRYVNKYEGYDSYYQEEKKELVNVA